MSRDFLISGMEFYKYDGKKFIIRRCPSYYGITISCYSKSEDSKISTKIFSDTYKWIRENNLLKKEAFSLDGNFIKKTDETWDSVFLDGENEKSMKQTVNLLNKKQADLANRGLIFMGPPGTGKTLSGRVIRNIADATFIWVSARDFIYSGSIGGINYGFRLAKELAPSVLFIEDIDNWLDGWSIDLMKSTMDGLVTTKGIVTILTSNYPELLPPALIDRPGRFHDVLEFALPIPSKKVRLKMLKGWINADIEQKMIDYVIEKTAGFSGAHMYELVNFAKTIADEDEISINNALQISLDKILSQREMIQGLSEKDFDYDQEVSIIDMAKDVEHKAGRVLSKKTRSIMNDAVSSMSKATSALNELMESVDSSQSTDIDDEEKSSDDIIVKIDDEHAQEDTIDITDSDMEKLKVDLTDTFQSILRERGVDVNRMVQESLDKVKGKIF